jgi:hypothetical protein
MTRIIGNQGKKHKQSLSPAPSKNKIQKNWIVHECILTLPISCMKLLFPKQHQNPEFGHQNPERVRFQKKLAKKYIRAFKGNTENHQIWW